jgi:hypothetical protein
MNVLTLVPLQDTEVFVPVEAFDNGSLTNPSTWPVVEAVRPIYDTSPLNYLAAAWELDEDGVWNIKRTWNLAAGRYDLWIKVTMPTSTREVHVGVFIVESP